MPCHSSRQVFEAAGASNVLRTTRCRVLQRFAAVRLFRPPLSIAHKQKRLQWARQYMKTDFKTVLFTHECWPPHANKATAPTKRWWSDCFGLESWGERLSFVKEHFLPWFKKKIVLSETR
ncbi:hypothetical protein GBF38_022282 [Nibea albiflora]|uniref:Uncharacterized protein n=1 Tax=Nibea albiflora TaxID=240163 RepID=A0ACB7FLH8_NIBAL|nr:hypothetical protein GBF38_022282 [Nibea albiflora]